IPARLRAAADRSSVHVCMLRSHGVQRTHESGAAFRRRSPADHRRRRRRSFGNSTCAFAVSVAADRRRSRQEQVEHRARSRRGIGNTSRPAADDTTARRRRRSPRGPQGRPHPRPCRPASMKANRPNTAKPAQPVQAVSDPDFKFPSFFAMWRDWIVKSEQQWSENVSNLLKDERAASLIGKQVDEARMMHKMYAEMMQSYLAAANLPSRLDLEWLDERMGRVE